MLSVWGVWCGGLTSQRVVVSAAQAAAQLGGQALVAAAAGGPLVVLVELGASAQRRVAHGAREVVHAPRLVQRREHISSDDLVAYIAKVAKQLMVMLFTISQAFLLVMPMTMKWLLALGTYEMLNMPVFSKSSHNPFFNRAATSTTNWNAHFIMAPQAKQIIHIVSRIAWTILDFSCSMVELNTASRTSKVITMIHLATVTEWFSIDYAMALMTHVVLQSIRLDTCIASMTEGTTTMFDKAGISQLNITFLTTKT